MTHAAESAHWYTRTGAVAYTVAAKDGSPRPTTLRDARKLNLVPSVTTIIKCAAAPGLEIWKQNQVMLAAMTLPKKDGEPEAEYIRRVMEDSKEHAKNAAERGTAIHAAIQDFYETGFAAIGFQEHIIGATKAVEEILPGSENWTPERSFASRMGFGGKVDLSCFDDGCGYVLDFKTKEFSTTDDLRTWDEHAMQLSAYREGLGYPDARCAIVYVSTTVPGLAAMLEIPEEDLKRGWRCFYSLLHFWQAKNNYTSAFESLAA